MSIVESFFLFYERLVLVYFAVLALLYAYFAFLGVRAVIAHARESSPSVLSDFLSRDIHKPVSILVPAFNEEATIVESVRSLLALHFPEFEVVIANDGSVERRESASASVR